MRNYFWIGLTVLLFEKNQRSTCLARLIMELLVLRFWYVLLHICFFCFHLSIVVLYQVLVILPISFSLSLFFTMTFDGNMMVIWRKWKIVHLPLNFDSHGNLMEMLIFSFEWLSVMNWWHLFFCGLCFASKWHMYYVTNDYQELGVMNFYAQFFCKLILQTNMYWRLTSMCEVSTSWSFKQIHIKVQLQIVKHLTTTRYSLFGECFFFFLWNFSLIFCMVTLKPPSLVHAFVIYHYRTKPKFSWSQHWLIIQLLCISCFFVIHLLNRLNFLSFFVAYKTIFYKILKKRDGDASL